MKSIPNESAVQSDFARAKSVEERGVLTVRPIPGGLGAEISGIDLSEPIPDASRKAIRAAFLDHHVLVFHQQRLNEEAMDAFARIFGEVEGNVFRQPDGRTMEAIHQISNLDASGQPGENAYVKSNYYWHTDKAYLPVPALLTMLHAIELPPSGGDTQFADMTKAYAALPAGQKRTISALRAVHSLEYMRVSTNDRPLTEAERQAAPPVTHPLVRTHPDTGKKSLYLGMYCAGIVGLDEAGGRALLDQLLAHATQDRFVYTHRWQPGDVVLWDNRCLVHRAVANYAMRTYRRVLQRVVVKGSAPY